MGPLAIGVVSGFTAAAAVFVHTGDLYLAFMSYVGGGIGGAAWATIWMVFQPLDDLR